MHFREAVGKAIGQLLSAKHLYQHVEVNFSYLDEIAKWDFETAEDSIGRMRRSTVQDFRARLDSPWLFAWAPDTTDTTQLLVEALRPLTKVPPSTKRFFLPGIEALCPHCDKRWPFNPKASVVDQSPTDSCVQVFHVSYECQKCKKEPLRFMVLRAGKRLTLTGRSVIETVEVPPFLPKKQAHYYSGACIAHQCGQTLAGLFLLRVFIEQYWRSLPEVIAHLKKESQPSGESLGSAYNRILDPRIKESFPSLSALYAQLSNAIHSANPDAELFASVATDIVLHFEAVKLFEVTKSKARAGA